MAPAVKKQPSGRGGGDAALQEGSLCVLTVSLKTHETSQKFSPMRSTATFGHHRIHAHSCKTTEYLPPHQIPF